MAVGESAADADVVVIGGGPAGCSHAFAAAEGGCSVTIVGATGERACGMADGFTTALRMGATPQDLADMVPAHPTRSELLGEAARQAMAAS
jgi:pyruvate/2-oxoglutarate dehydrogenase complex dihydrolipoamide dehydrogenase (E3) component